MNAPARIVLAGHESQEFTSLKAGLEAAGYAVILRPDELTAYMQVRRDPPDVVVADVALPAGGAALLVGHIRQNVHTALVPAVVLVDSSSQEHSLRELGARECLQKPVDADEVVAVVRHVLDEPEPVNHAPRAVLADPERLSVLGSTGLLERPTDSPDPLVLPMGGEFSGAADRQ